MFVGVRRPHDQLDTLSVEGVLYEALERKDRLANRALVVLGGRRGPVGTGLIAATREAEVTRWRDVTRVRAHGRLGVVTLLNRWRVVQRLHCPREDFERILAYAREHAGHAKRTLGAGAR